MLTLSQYAHLLSVCRAALVRKDQHIRELEYQLEEAKQSQVYDADVSDNTDNELEDDDRFSELEWDYSDPTYRLQMWDGNNLVYDSTEDNGDEDSDEDDWESACSQSDRSSDTQSDNSDVWESVPTFENSKKWETVSNASNESEGGVPVPGDPTGIVVTWDGEDWIWHCRRWVKYTRQEEARYLISEDQISDLEI